MSILTYGNSLPKSLEAAEMLAEEGIEAEVVDLRVLRPLDNETIFGSVTAYAAAASSSTRAGRAARSRPRSPRAFRRICSSNSTRRSGAFASRDGASPPMPAPPPYGRSGPAAGRADRPKRRAAWRGRNERLFLCLRWVPTWRGGKIVEWLVKPGSTVKKGDVIAVVETHKGAFEIDVFQEGTITELCAKEGRGASGRGAAGPHYGTGARSRPSRKNPPRRHQSPRRLHRRPSPLRRQWRRWPHWKRRALTKQRAPPTEKPTPREPEPSKGAAPRPGLRRLDAQR